ncbi:LCP family protein [Patescibacteria group bacterium]|nr:LCP family protein [Patescibacteria group bacterium]
MGWRYTQSKIKKSKQVKLALIVLGIILGLLVLSWAIRFVNQMFSPWNGSSETKHYVWNGKFNLNLLVRSKGISLFSYNPKQGKIVIINIPDETFLEVPGGFGSWQLRSIYDLGESEKAVGGNKLLLSALTSFLGMPIDGFLDFSMYETKSTGEIVDILRANPFSGINLLYQLKTDLTPWELIRLKTAIAGVRFDKIKEMDLAELNVLEKKNLPDGQEVYYGDSVKLDSIMADLADPILVSEHISIAIFNATAVPGLAQKWARLVTNLGGNVIITANATEQLKKTQIIGERSPTYERLGQIFASADKIKPLSGDLASRAQINLILGEDYSN